MDLIEDGYGGYIEDEDVKEKKPMSAKTIGASIIGSLLLAALTAGMYRRTKGASGTPVAPTERQLKPLVDTMSTLMVQYGYEYGYTELDSTKYMSVLTNQHLAKRITDKVSDIYEYIGPNDRCNLYVRLDPPPTASPTDTVAILHHLSEKVKLHLNRGSAPLKIITLVGLIGDRPMYQVYANRTFKNMRVMKSFLVEKGFAEPPLKAFIHWGMYDNKAGRLIRCFNQCEKGSIGPESRLRSMDENNPFEPIETLLRYHDLSSNVIYDVIEE